MAAAVRSMAGRMGRTNEEKEALQEDIMQAILEDDDAWLEQIIDPPPGPKPTYNDAEGKNACSKLMIYITSPFYETAYGSKSGYFDTFIFAVIILAGGMVGVQTYPKFNCNAPMAQDAKWAESITVDDLEYCKENSDSELDFMGGGGYIDEFIKWTFVLECFTKIMANGSAPWRYWCGHAEYKWNLFDFILVLLSFSQIADLLGLGSNIMVLRLFRLARLFKLVGKVPKLQQIVIGLVAGVKAVGYIAILLFLVFYIFAIGGMIFFLPNDPLHFRNIPVAMLSLLRAATLEDWTDIMYINIYGCDKFASGLYYVKSKYVDPLTGDEIAGAFDDSPFYECWEGCDKPVPNYFRCNDIGREGEMGQAMLSASYWILFVFVSAFVMLSLFVGAVTLAMSESMDPDQEDVEKPAAFAKGLILRRNYLRDNKLEFKKRLIDAWNAYASQNGDTKKLKTTIAEEDQPENKLGVWSWAIARPCKAITETSFFVGLVTFAIIVAGVLIGVDQEVRGEPAPDATEAVNQALYSVDMVINVIFTIEVAMKLIGEDWHPWRYFHTAWNNFDFIIVVSSWLPMLFDALDMEAPPLGALKLLRLLRLFRVLRVIKFLPALAVIVDSLLAGFESIGFIALILFVVFYLFAILGMMLFQENDPFHFGKLHWALLTLFRVSTFEDWTDVMYINIYKCTGWGYNDDDNTVPRTSSCDPAEHPTKGELQPWAAIFFIIFVFLAALVLLTLFIGVITTSMESAQDLQKEKTKCLTQLGAWAKSYNIPTKCIVAIEKCFADIDLDDSGDASVHELRVAMKFTDLITHEGGVENLMREIDIDGDGTVDLYEFGLYVMNQMANLAGSQKRFHPQDPESGVGMRKPSFSSNGMPLAAPSPHRKTTVNGNGLDPIKEASAGAGAKKSSKNSRQPRGQDQGQAPGQPRSRPRNAHKSTPPGRAGGAREPSLEDIEMQIINTSRALADPSDARSASTSRVDGSVSSRANERAFADERGMSLPRESPRGVPRATNKAKQTMVAKGNRI